MHEASAAVLPPEVRTEHVPHALVVDDDVTNRLILRGLLTRLGYRITECVNGADAVAASRETHKWSARSARAPISRPSISSPTAR